MKKLLGLLLVMALAWPTSADVLKNVDLIGEIETIASDVHHNPGPVYNQAVNTRVIAGLSAQLVEDVTANLSFQHVTSWNGNAAGDTVQNYWDNVELSQANVVISNLFDCFEATVGRQFYGDEDSAVMYFGPNHYNAETLWAPSLDAAKLTYADDVKALTVIAGKTVSALNSLGNNINGTTILGADFRMNLSDTMKVQAYIYDFRNVDAWGEMGEEDAHAGLYGAKLTLNPEAALLSAEYARNFGGDRLIKEHNDTGYMVKVDGAMTVKEFTVRGAFLYEHENFLAFGNYTPGLLIGHPLAGNINGYAEGIRMFNAGIDFNPFEKWTFSLDGYTFQDRYGHHDATYEGDLTVKYAHNDYVQLFAGLGYAKLGNDEFAAGATYKDFFNKDNFKWQLGMLINF